MGLAHAPLLSLPVLPSLSLAPAGGPQPCPLCPSMSPESFVSGVVRVHLCARVCARGTGVLSCLCAVWTDGGWPVFTLSVFLLVFFYSLLILIALCHQPKLSSLRSARRLVFFTSYPSTVGPPTVPVSWDQRAWSAPSGSLQPCLPASWPLLITVWAGRLAGPGMGGQAFCPACPCCLSP